MDRNPPRTPVPQQTRQSPRTPTHSFTMPPTPVSGSVPRSEYLRDALRDRKALESRLKETPKTNGHSDTFYADVDWVAEVEPGDNAANSVGRRPSRRRRQSDRALATSNGTMSKELETNVDKLAKENFSLKLKLTLQQERMKNLEAELETMSALKRENQELTERLTEKEKECMGLEDVVADLQEDNEKNIELHEELMKHLEIRDTAVTEATDMILDLERKVENLESSLKEQGHALRQQSSDYFSTEGAHDARSSLESVAEEEHPERRANTLHLSPCVQKSNKRHSQRMHELTHKASIGSSISELRSRVSVASESMDGIPARGSSRGAPELGAEPRRRRKPRLQLERVPEPELQRTPDQPVRPLTASSSKTKKKAGSRLNTPGGTSPAGGLRGMYLQGTENRGTAGDSYFNFTKPLGPSSASVYHGISSNEDLPGPPTPDTVTLPHLSRSASVTTESTTYGCMEPRPYKDLTYPIPPPESFGRDLFFNGGGFDDLPPRRLTPSKFDRARTPRADDERR